MFKTVSWKTGPNRGQFKQQPKNKKLIKKFHDAWAEANGYKLQAPSGKLQAQKSLTPTKSLI